MRARSNLILFFSRFLKKDTPLSFIVLFFTRKVRTVISLNEVKPSPDRKIRKIPTFDNFLRHYDILAKTRDRMISRFPAKSDVDLRARTT